MPKSIWCLFLDQEQLESLLCVSPFHVFFPPLLLQSPCNMHRRTRGETSTSSCDSMPSLRERSSKLVSTACSARELLYENSGNTRKLLNASFVCPHSQNREVTTCAHANPILAVLH